MFGVNVPDESTSLIERCSTMSYLPGHEIERSIGVVEFTKKNIGEEIPKLTHGIFQALLDTARKRGANAVVNIRLESGSFRDRFDLQTCFIIAYGDAVLVR